MGVGNFGAYSAAEADDAVVDGDDGIRTETHQHDQQESSRSRVADV